MYWLSNSLSSTFTKLVSFAILKTSFNAVMKRKKTEYYVNNKEFLAAITAYREQVHAAEEAGEERPRVNNYIGSCFLKIATHLSYKPNFVNYMFREDMICDGIENCLQYICLLYTSPSPRDVVPSRMPSSA